MPENCHWTEVGRLHYIYSIYIYIYIYTHTYIHIHTRIVLVKLSRKHSSLVKLISITTTT